jgi:hypothetical protein
MRWGSRPGRRTRSSSESAGLRSWPPRRPCDRRRRDSRAHRPRPPRIAGHRPDAMDPPYRAWLIRDPTQEFLDCGSGRDFHSDELVGLHRLVIAESARFPELALILHSSGDARHIARLPERIRAERGPASDPTAGGCSASTSAHSGGSRPAREGGPGTARPQVNSRSVDSRSTRAVPAAERRKEAFGSDASRGQHRRLTGSYAFPR